MDKFVCLKFFENLNKLISIKNWDYILLADGYLDIDSKLSVVQNKTTGTIKLLFSSGPEYCIGSRKKNSRKKLYESFEIPEKYKLLFDELKISYNNHLEKISKEQNKTFIII